MTQVALVDYGAGNLLSIGQALVQAGAEVSIALGPADLGEADAVVLPGVGASGPAMARLRRARLADAISARVRDGLPYLGICLGLQLLFEQSEEDGAALLDLLPGTVRAIPGAPRLPHVGWNQVEPVRRHPLLAGVEDRAAVYFVHSYAGFPRDSGDVVAETEHGGRFPSVVARGSTYGVQFHPERSGDDGLRILRNFVELAGGSGTTPVPGLAAARAGA